MKIRVGTVLFLFLALPLAGCGSQADQINPRNSGVWLISEEMEVSVGAEVAQSIESEYEVLHDPALDVYVNDIGQRLAVVSDRPNLQYRFTVLETPIVNAFAAPGGFIYVTTGLLGALDDEAMFASVVGHEIGHVAARHGAKRMQAALLTQFALTVLYVAFEDDIDENYFIAANAVVNLVFLGYSRGDEKQADILGAKYAYNAGYNPYGMRDVLVVFHRMAGRDPVFVEQLLSSHPAPGERIEHVEGWIQTLYDNDGNPGPRPNQLARNRETYQRIARRYGEFDDNGAVSAVIENLRIGINTRNLRLAMDALSADYLDDRGYNKEGFESKLRDLYNNYQSVRYAVVSDPVVEMNNLFEATATYRCETTLVSFGDRRELWGGDVRLILRREGDRWFIVSSNTLLPTENASGGYTGKG